jgi:PAS domain S-box-containing protein
VDVDLRPLRQAEAGRRKAQREMQLILDTTSEMFARYDRDLRIQWANRAAAESVEMSVGQLVGEHCYEVWHGREERCPDCPVVAAMQIGQPQQSEIQTPDGHWFDLRAYPLRDKQGRISGAIEFGADITARKQAEQALRQTAQRCEQLADSREALLREMDHRMKNSLAGLNTLVDICARSADSIEQFSALMHEKIDAMRLVHGLIMDQRGRHGDLASLVRQVIGEFATSRGAPEVQYQGPSLQIGPRQAGPMVMVLHELFTNAQKYGALSGEGGRIELNWRAVDMGSEGQRIGLSWRETGGPPLDREPVPGVGLGLIEGFCRFELRGGCDFEFQPDGLRCELHCTLDNEDGGPG